MKNKVVMGGILVVLAGLLLKKKSDDKKRKQIAVLGAAFDEQDRDFLTQTEMRDAFRARTVGKELSSEDLLEAFSRLNPSDQSGF